MFNHFPDYSVTVPTGNVTAFFRLTVNRRPTRCCIACACGWRLNDAIAGADADDVRLPQVVKRGPWDSGNWNTGDATLTVLEPKQRFGQHDPVSGHDGFLTNFKSFPQVDQPGAMLGTDLVQNIVQVVLNAGGHVNIWCCVHRFNATGKRL